MALKPECSARIAWERAIARGSAAAFRGEGSAESCPQGCRHWKISALVDRAATPARSSSSSFRVGHFFARNESISSPVTREYFATPCGHGTPYITRRGCRTASEAIPWSPLPCCPRRSGRAQHGPIAAFAADAADVPRASMIAAAALDTRRPRNTFPVPFSVAVRSCRGAVACRDRYPRTVGALIAQTQSFRSSPRFRSGATATTPGCVIETAASP